MHETNVHFASVDGVRIVTIGCEVDIANAATLQRYLDEAITNVAPLVVSLAGCDFIDSSGLRPVLQLAAPHAGTSNLRSRGLSARFNLCDTFDDALARASEKPCFA